MHKPGLFDDAPEFSGSHAPSFGTAQDRRGNPADPRCGSVARRATAAFPRMPWEREEPSPLGTRLGKGYLFQLQSLLLLITLCLLSTPQLAKAATAVGATPGSFKVSETGAATYTIPLTVPPGAAGMAPSLSLNYNSQSGNGPLGMGWSLGGLTAIYRCPATLAQDGFKGGINYDMNDRYCLDGQRLVVISGAYGADGAEYRTETESYTRIVSFGQAGVGPASFKAWTKAGQIIEYGNTDDSRIEAQGKATVRLWNVNKISDTKGNYIAASYTEDNANGEAYINRIDYTGNAAAGVAPYASVRLSYDTRSDIESGYESGSLIKNSKRISSIKTYISENIIKDYRLAYELSQISQRSRVISVLECSDANTCLPALTFSFDQASGSSYKSSSYTDVGDKCLLNCGIWQTGDVNGDGKTDLIHITSIPGTTITWLSNGDGNYKPVGYTDAGDKCLLSCGIWQTGDVNGDGKTDLIHITSIPGTTITWLSNGDGNYRPVGYTDAGDKCLLNCGIWQAGDVNGDGKTDLIHITSIPGTTITWLSNGDGNYRTIAYTDAGDKCLLNCGIWQAGDINGDGKTDLMHITSIPGTVINWMSAYTATDFITSVHDGFGATKTIFYKSLSDGSFYAKDTNAAYPYFDFQGSLYAVLKTLTSDGTGGNYATNFIYAGAKLHLTGGGFLGFRQVAANDPQTGITTTTTYSQNYPYQGLPQSVEKRTASGVLLNSAQNTWQNTAINGMYHRNDLIQTVEQSWDLNGAAMPRTKTNTTFDAYGNPTQITVATDDGYTAAGPVNPYGNVKTTTNAYFNDPVNWLLGRLVKASVTSTLANGTTATRTSAFVYASDSGLLIQETIEPDNTSLKLVTDYTLDGFGNRVAVKTSGADIATRTSTTTFDTQGRFAIASANALGHTENRSFDPGFGNPLSLTGPNGLTTYWAYDGFGRKTQESRADGTQSAFTFNFCAANCPANAVYYTTATASGAPASNAYFDSLNREIRRETVGFDGRVATMDKVYYYTGLVAFTSRPYFPGDAISWTGFQYDILGRTLKIFEADGGVTQTSYNGLAVSVTNALNHTTQQTKNGLGQVVQTVDALGNALAFTFDPFGNPLKTIDPKGNIITLAYDIRGRKTAMTDPDMGTWLYTYDTLGEMLSQKDAKGQTTTVSYDLLGRVVKRVEPDLTSVWTWDSALKGKGKLAAESSGNGFKRAYAYDNYGRLAQTTTTLGTSAYTQATLYDSFGRVSRFVQPTGFSTLNVYNGNGYLAEVRDAASQKPFWQAQQVDASGRITLEKLGNNLYTQRSFDGMGRPTYIATGKFGVTPDIQNLYLNHDLNGNLTSRDDYATQRGDSFIYDELDRLTSDLGPGGKILNYQYDTLGNITFKTDVGSYFYGTKPHAVTKITGNINATLLYDANGNQTLGLNNRTVAYTAFNLPSKIVQGVNTVTFDYDANHERFRQTGPNGTTIYLNPRMDLRGHFEQTTAAGVAESRHTVYAGGKAIAEVVTRSGGYQQTRYFHADHLGSIDAVTDDNAVVLARYAFDPFGARTPLYGDVNMSRHGFTGHEHLPEVGLIHMNGRVYDPVLGRFLSADPSIQAPGNLQDYNRYSYALNNPLVFTDPSGYSWFSKFMHSTIGKIVTIAAVIAVSFYTFGAVAGLVQGYMETAAGVCFASMPTMAAVAGGAAAGFAGGFTGGFLGSGGDLNAALQNSLLGALAGGFTFGLNASFSTYSWYYRAIAAGMGGGVGARAYGGNFGRGFEYAFLAALGKTALDTYVRQNWLEAEKENYDSSLKPASLNAVQKPDGDLVDKYGNTPIGSCSVGNGACGGPLYAQTGAAFETNSTSSVGIIAPTGGGICIAGENCPFMLFLSKNVPGVQAFSITHDIAMGQLQVSMGQSFLFGAINKLTIVPFAYTQYQALGLQTTQYELDLMKHGRH